MVESLVAWACLNHPSVLWRNSTYKTSRNTSSTEELIRLLAFSNVSQFLQKLSASGKTGESQSIIVQQECLFLMKTLRISLEDPLEWTSLALLSGACPQSSSPASAGMSAETDEKIKCCPCPGADINTPTSQGRLSNESARISRAKETRRSVTSPWQISALETALHVCTAAPCSSAGQGRCWDDVGHLKQMCLYCLPKWGNGREKRKEEFFLVENSR